LSFMKYFKSGVEKTKNIILAFAPLTLVIVQSICVLIFYGTKPFQDGYFLQSFSSSTGYYLIVSITISVLACAGKRVFAATLFVFVLAGQVQAFQEQYQQHISGRPTMGPILTLYTFTAFGFLLGLCFECFSGIRNNLKIEKR
jgi:hypothetical protein